MKVEFKFKNGQKVIETITGLVGIIDMQTVKSTGNLQYSVQPKIKEGENTRPEGWFIDEDSLELLEDNNPDKGTYNQEFKYALGLQVKDGISGFSGVIDRAGLYLNGCVQYLVKGKYIEKLDKVASLWVDESHIVVNEQEPLNPNFPKDRTGGPATSSATARI